MTNKEYLKKQEFILNSFIDIDTIINLTEIEFMKKIYNVSKKVLSNYDNAGLFEYDNNKLKIIYSKGYDKEKINNLSIDKKVVLSHFKQNGLYKDKNIITTLDKKQNSKEIYFYNIKINGVFIGGFFFEIIESNESHFEKHDLKLLEFLKMIINNYNKHKKYKATKERQLIKTVETLTTVLDVHDNYTNSHSLEVAQLSKKIGIEMGLSQKKVDDLYLTGLLHDIGKTFINKSILNKPSRLTINEFNQIKKHPRKGAELLNNFPELRNIRKNILHHHEQWNGMGYPSNLEKEEIPFLATIIAVADAYSAMTNNRPYKKAISKQEALIEIDEKKGTQFNPVVVEAFLKLMNPNNINLKKYYIA